MGHLGPMVEDRVRDLLQVVASLGTGSSDLDAELLVELVGIVTIDLAEGPPDAELVVEGLGGKHDADGLTLLVLDVLDDGFVGHGFRTFLWFL